MKNGYGRWAAWACGLGIGLGAISGAFAGDVAQQVTDDATDKVASAAADTQPVCAEVTVNGVRTPSYECLTQKLQPKAPPQGPDGAQPAQPGLASEAIVLRPSNQLGLFNRAATSTRMGNTFGTSVYPQRPPQVQPSLPVGPR